MSTQKVFMIIPDFIFYKSRDANLNLQTRSEYKENVC